MDSGMATTAPKTVFSHITKNPKVRGGKACIEGTRISVKDIVCLHEEGRTPEQMLNVFGTPLTLSQIHAALARSLVKKPGEGIPRSISTRGGRADTETSSRHQETDPGRGRTFGRNAARRARFAGGTIRVAILPCRKVSRHLSHQ